MDFTKERRRMFVAGDIGGTKTTLALYEEAVVAPKRLAAQFR